VTVPTLLNDQTQVLVARALSSVGQGGEAATTTTRTGPEVGRDSKENAIRRRSTSLKLETADMIARPIRRLYATCLYARCFLSTPAYRRLPLS